MREVTTLDDVASALGHEVARRAWRVCALLEDGTNAPREVTLDLEPDRLDILSRHKRNRRRGDDLECVIVHRDPNPENIAAARAAVLPSIPWIYLALTTEQANALGVTFTEERFTKPMRPPAWPAGAGFIHLDVGLTGQLYAYFRWYADNARTP